MAGNRYEQIIERIFLAHYKRGNTEITFDREEIPKVAGKLRIEIPKNLGDLIYSFRYPRCFADIHYHEGAKRKRVDYPPCWSQQISVCFGGEVGNCSKLDAVAT